MNISRTLTTHAEKIEFVLAYLEGKVVESPEYRPLFIFGSGGNGKTIVLTEVQQLSRHPFCHMSIEKTVHYCPGQQVRSEPTHCIPLIVQCLGTPQDEQFAGYMDAYCVEFAKDPAYFLPKPEA